VRASPTKHNVPLQRPQQQPLQTQQQQPDSSTLPPPPAANSNSMVSSSSIVSSTDAPEQQPQGQQLDLVQHSAAAAAAAPPWPPDIPWGLGKVVQVMGLWLLAYLALGQLVVPALLALLGVDQAALGPRGSALLNLSLDLGQVGITAAILAGCLGHYRPQQRGLFRLAWQGGRWLWIVAAGVCRLAMQLVAVAAMQPSVSRLWRVFSYESKQPLVIVRALHASRLLQITVAVHADRARLGCCAASSLLGISSRCWCGVHK
jgi:hypothetical protein